ncbi:hypothetical protein E1B28_011554 [Marasmius oreades]|uniref:Uncharacterized protein n=1 Tax=Marasmius oreades TaxID=181124 RepID=A0A9P7RUB4_9AGAR|nr:uncharacterized protein E1B28_011554 [Marasmius oreades]KAG7089921.1 hypothetical protein E1B28_011554 [Marasmius oreades]
MDYGTGSLMVLDAVLLSLAAIASSQQREIVIFPEIRFAGYDKVQVSHPVTGYELSLRGSVDYTIIEIDNVDNRKARLLRPEGSQVLFLKHRNAQVLFLLVKAKYRDPEQTFASHIPEAVGQAITLMKYMNITESRFCLSDGLNWRFYILKSEDGMLTCYGSALYCLSKDSLQESDQSLREIMQLICEWVWPTTPDLFVLAKSAGRV